MTNHADDSVIETALVCVMEDGDARIYDFPLLNLRFYRPAVVAKEHSRLLLRRWTVGCYGDGVLVAMEMERWLLWR